MIICVLVQKFYILLIIYNIDYSLKEVIIIKKKNVLPKLFYVISLFVSIILFPIHSNDKAFTLVTNMDFNLIPDVEAALIENCSPSTLQFSPQYTYVANAGQDKNVNSGAQVTLDPTGSNAYALFCNILLNMRI